MKNKVTAKRRLSDINFEKEGSHIALVSEEQGHGANGHHYALVMKATEKLSDSFLEKASKIKVTMEITEYLERFFNLYSFDAEILARSLGFTTKRQEESDNDVEEEDSDYQDWIDSQVASIEVMKALNGNQKFSDVLSSLDEDQYLQFLKDQSKIEKCLNRINLIEDLNLTKNSKQKLVLNKEKVKLNGSILKEGLGGCKNMSKDKVQVIEQTEEIEVVAKAEYDELLKSVSDKEALLTKALAEVEQYKLEKAAVIAKARKDQLVSVCGLETAEIVFKACQKAEDSDFDDLVKTLGLLQKQLEKNELFKEVGVSGSAEPEDNLDPVVKALRGRLSVSK